MRMVTVLIVGRKCHYNFKSRDSIIYFIHIRLFPVMSHYYCRHFEERIGDSLESQPHNKGFSLLEGLVLLSMEIIVIKYCSYCCTGKTIAAIFLFCRFSPLNLQLWISLKVLFKFRTCEVYDK